MRSAAMMTVVRRRAMSSMAAWNRADVEVSIGSVRTEWRNGVRRLAAFPALQHLALETAAYFTDPADIDFGYPRTFRTQYTLGKQLGEGAFGTVYQVAPKDNAVTLDLAVKVIQKDRLASRKDFLALRQEARIMMLLGGTLNVVHYFGAYEDERAVYLVMEHCVGGEAYARMHTDVATEADRAASYMLNVLHVVWQCHLLDILHGDLKLENFLFADDQVDSPLKLTDFGGAAFVVPDAVVSGLRGTPLYTAPEVLQGNYALPADMWSCGVILYRLLSGSFPFEGALLDEQILHAPIDVESGVWVNVSPDAKDLVRKLLERDPRTRLSAHEALRHPWMAQAFQERKDARRQVPRHLGGTMIQRLQLYRTLNGFQQAVFIEMTKRVPKASKVELAVLFSEICVDGASSIGVKDLARGFQNGGYKLTWGEVKSFLSRMDIDGDGVVSFDEFCCAFLDWHAIQQDSSVWRTLVETAFDTFDTDRDGKIHVADLVPHMPVRMVHTFLSDVQRCFAHADSDKDGAINLIEFERILLVQDEAWARYAPRYLWH
ncbi:CAMK/CDPK protein kinase [Saprolegnia parasitica CBS 223.65]|uniref:CAMK/CDPK protein kinase n=1 Tax=Saprolegnia parasitica (strain CBS 223.65) TaxID=695850 RepID=A0A067CN80_SAPPC|nr:CAMK/CDPK protein kinase [Saprolegnia parasitica CBS 223.65]KDO30665.1 CAMK/CDPK protein kinase [Saprolegnia parasitica CBS 223.65]|eukprot:XP_012198369.1 CAMK/CDPK protein kinase [Saprolegnia parasitica CBS 223.65]